MDSQLVVISSLTLLILNLGACFLCHLKCFVLVYISSLSHCLAARPCGLYQNIFGKWRHAVQHEFTKMYLIYLTLFLYWRVKCGDHVFAHVLNQQFSRY